MDTVKVWGSSDVLLKHLFQLLHTKAMSYNTPGSDTKASSSSATSATATATATATVVSFICVAGNMEELTALARLLARMSGQIGNLYPIILYCDYDYLYDISKSRASKEDVEFALRTLDYRFSQLLGANGVCTIDSYKMYTSTSYFHLDPMIVQKILLVPHEKRWSWVVRQVVNEFIVPSLPVCSSSSSSSDLKAPLTATTAMTPTTVLGMIAFNIAAFFHDTPKGMDKDDKDVSSQSVFFDMAVDGSACFNSFLSCVCLNMSQLGKKVDDANKDCRSLLSLDGEDDLDDHDDHDDDPCLYE